MTRKHAEAKAPDSSHKRLAKYSSKLPPTGGDKKKKKRETESYYYSSYYWHANWQIIRNLKKTDIIGCCPHEVITKSLHAARLPKRDCITVAERRPLCCRR